MGSISRSARRRNAFENRPPEAKLLARNPGAKAAADAWIATAYAKFKAQMKNGAGLPMDQLLREFCNEYNQRLVRRAPNLPMSWNTTSAFLTWHQKNRLLYLLPERDHMIALDDFLSFTDSSADTALSTAWEGMPEGEVFHYNMIQPFDDFVLSSEGGREICIAGITVAKQNSELAAMVLCGIIDDPLLSEPGLDASFLTEAQQRLKTTVDPQAVTTAVPLQGCTKTRALRSVAFARMNPITRETSERLVYRDAGQVYRASTDSPDALAIHDTASRDFALATAHEDLSTLSAVFDFMAMAPLLSSYMSYRRDVIVTEKRPTRLSAGVEGPKQQESSAAAIPDANVVFRLVQSVKYTHQAAPGSDPRQTRHIQPPAYRVSVSGFWRSLLPGQTGHDHEGRPISGRTWVRSHLRWRDRPEPPRTVLVKQRIQPASSAEGAQPQADKPAN